MSSLIEQAAQRLEQLRRAGIEVPASPPPDVSAGARPVPPGAARGFQPTGPGDGRLPPHPVSRRVELDLARMAAAGIVTPNAPRSLLTDQYRVIKRPLLRNATGRGDKPLMHGNLIMVTSALPGEGKSFNAVNLAISIAAELDHTVMLVDADVEESAVPGMLGVEPGPGLLDVLDGSQEIASVLLRTNIDGLTLMRAGTHHERATELLASDAMRELLREMATRYPERIIVFDSPPLLPTTEARVLASHMGQVVVVVQAEKTLQSQVESALATIETCPVRMLLLNQVRGATEDTYGYGYSYAYGQADGADAAGPQPPGTADVPAVSSGQGA